METKTAPSMQDTAGALLGNAAGYVGYRTISMGLRQGLIQALADSEDGATSDELAAKLGCDSLYTAVWCRAALGAGVVEHHGDRYAMTPHAATLLLDRESPGYVGALFPTLEQPEVFARFESVLGSGERMWWSDTSPDWIASVSGTGTPFYTRLVPNGLGQVPGLTERLEAGCRVVDSACGAGRGIFRLATAYPNCHIVGVDGDRHSLDTAAETVAAAGIGDRVSLVHTPLEDMKLDEPVTVVINNISMHECRDIDRVTERISDSLEPGGWFVVSDFPFPETDDGLRTVPGRIMSGIQYFEAQIDDQLLPRSAYDALLERHGFSEIGNTTLTPMHALTWGRA
jgi:ubiquinone/menaquinone biosynthesis C-methylase UbiE